MCPAAWSEDRLPRVHGDRRGHTVPGHLGGPTRVVPFELVDAVLEETRTVQRRLRDLPSRGGVYFLWAMCLFPEIGYRLVWQKLTAGLVGVPVAEPTAKALCDLRRGVGSAPMRGLGEGLSGPLAQPRTPGVRFGGYRTVSFDGRPQLEQGPGHRPQPSLARLSGPGRIPPCGADDAGRDRNQGSDRRSLRPHQRGRDRPCPAPAAPADARHAGLVGQGLRRQRLPPPGDRHRRTPFSSA
ncbi:transposase domain-containing protein [Streptomyces sp. KMM 9044]|uniref:transposase domain-containing protein n=1 Tax=Streptomyces sp. KMM 9044 TaxID=2744474 RepID=UPI003FA7C515